MPFRLSPLRVIIGVLVFLAVAAVVFSFFGRAEDAPELPLSDVIQRAKDGEVAKIEVRGDHLIVTVEDGQEFESRKERDSSIIDTLANAGVAVGGSDGVTVDVDERGPFARIIGIFLSFLPLLIFGGILFFFMRMAFRGSQRKD